MTQSRKWKGKTGGSLLGQQGLLILLKFADLRLAYFIMAFVVPFYMLFSHKNCKTIYHFFRKHIGATPLQALVRTYKNHYLFGQTILDRFLIFAKGKNPFELDIIGNEHFNRLIGREKGFLIASSHIGNFEICGYLLRQEKKKINALVYPGETETIRKNRINVLQNNNIHPIPVSDDLSHLFVLHAALQQGEVVTVLCDRHPGSPKCLTCDFLNGKADFPVGAFALADTLGVEVLSVFVIKESIKKYTVHIKPLSLDAQQAKGGKNERVAACVRAFVSEAEAIVRRYPEQWFNYYEFWKE